MLYPLILYLASKRGPTVLFALIAQCICRVCTCIAFSRVLLLLHALHSVSRNPGTSEPRCLRALRLSLVTHESLFVTSARPRASLRVSLHLRRQLIVVVRTRASLPQQSLACFSLALVKRVVTNLTLLCSLFAARHSYVKEVNDATRPRPRSRCSRRYALDSCLVS